MLSCCNLPQRNKIRPKSVNRYVEATSLTFGNECALVISVLFGEKCISANTFDKIFFMLGILARTSRVYQYLCQLSRLG